MKIIMERSGKEFDQTVAKIIAKQILLKPNSVIGFDITLKTHNYYKELVSITEQLKLDWSELKVAATFEYVGIDEDYKESVHEKLNNDLLNYTNICKDNIFIPEPYALATAKSCKDYETAVRSLGGVDLQVIDLSADGTIGMNIPHTMLNNDVFIVDVDDTAVDKKGRFSRNDFYPAKCIAMGVRMLMQAKTILLTAKGKDVARSIKTSLEGDITPENPASALQLHPNLIVLLDEDAASMMW